MGKELVSTLSKTLGPSLVVGLAHDALDITDPVQIASQLLQWKPAAVINCAAYTSVDGAESNREAAFALNARGPALLADACARTGTQLVHFGSDQVFSGLETSPSDERRAPAPANFYASSKLAGDLSVLKYPEHLVLRVQWLYGSGKDRFQSLKSQSSFKAFDDQWGAPTWTRDVAETTQDLLEKKASGLFHFAYDDYASWYDVFHFVRSYLNLNVELTPVSTASAGLPAQRPAFSVMANQKLLSVLGKSKMGSWKDSLKTFLNL